MKLHFLLAAAAALLCAAPIVAASEDNAIAFEGAKSVNSVLVDVGKKEDRPTRRPTRVRRTPQPTRRARRTPRPTRRPPSAERRDARDRTRIVRR
eukprot:scaffold1645_cov102-Skeletonema_dohrnii-CCMP3373.AAC.3